ncbi:hypothetical protein [Paraclostridium sordellii]|uniref:hypothetical protein n=1 Tax=Paraclostridium sordellii TaxID=1505 RepID=UPI000386C584|nr:hypothetical protein [Paeniclostridium sordellii]EPZ60446.1 hypothetical protein H476_0588 [[Clostridium] sordellii VPI 9048] [Paeniclostridium sordellii VPI 9048]CEK39124.1 hypothetical protein JGS6382_24561 [[Clostridium] sordellii] [Paeniclostridium sordellii]
MPKSVKKFRQTKKVAAAAIVTGIVLSGSNIYANEVETELNNDVVDKIEEPASKEEVKEEVKEETKEEVKEEQKENKKEENDKVQEVEKEEAPTVNKEKEEVKEEKKEENKKETSQKDREQLAYSIEEMRIAINLLDTADLTNDSNYERLNVFYKTSVERIQGISVSKDEQAHIDWIKEAANEIESKMYYINRVRHEVNRVNTVFETSRKDTLKNKQIVLDALGDSVEVGRNYVNSTTLNKAMNMYHELYANWDNELEKALEQLNYEIEETREAVNVMENKDLTVKENYDRMVAFMQAALDRLEGLYVLEGLENYSEHMNNLKANLENVKETAKLAKEIRETMDKVINAFDNNLSRDEKIEALDDLDDLGTLVDENKYKINTWTSYTAMELYHKYYALLENDPVEPEEPNKPEVPGEPDDDTVNPEDPSEPALPGEPDDDNTEEPNKPEVPENPNEPVLPGKPDDNNTENPNKPQVPVSPNKPATPGNSNVNNTVKPGFNKPSNNTTTNNTTNNKSSNGNKPKTGDMSMLGYIGLGLSSIVGLTINRKRK